MPEETKRPIGLISIDTKTVYDRISKCSIGDIVTYDDLSAMIGRDVRHKAAWVLSSARRRAFTLDAILFGTVPKVGVKRLSDSEIVDTANDAISRVHRLSLRAARRLTAVRDFKALPAQSQLRHDTYLSALAILSHVTKDKQMKKLEGHVEKAKVALPLQKTLEAFRE